MRIAVVAPSCSLSPEAAEAVSAIAARRGDCEIAFDPQCFLHDGHFAGSDSIRLKALRSALEDPGVDAVWAARGGYGSNRIAAEAVRDLAAPARSKPYLGYSDSGFLHAAMVRGGLRACWGPMVQDSLRDDGAAAITRALDWLVTGDAEALEPGLDGPAMAFNLTVLSNLLGTDIEPDFTEIDLLIEDVGEHLYRLDRTMFHLTGSANVRKVRRLRLGRVSDVPANDPDFGDDAEGIVASWCARAGIEYGGLAEIGHDSANRIVPFPADPS